MRIIFDQPVDKIAVESPIVFRDIKIHECLIEGRGVSGVISDFVPINMKFGIKVEFDEINHFPKFGCDRVISCPAVARIKIFS